MPSVHINLPVFFEEHHLNRILSCKPTQCATCPIYKRYCDGWGSCCGGNHAENQEHCRGECNRCMGMVDANDPTIRHEGTWNVCGKKQALLRVDEYNTDIPSPVYQKQPIQLDSPYLVSFNRLPRGPLREIPKLPYAVTLGASDMKSKSTKPELWTRYSDYPIAICSELDSIQDEIEGWYVGRMPTLKANGCIKAISAIEFSCYDQFGNLSHYRSIRRCLETANQTRADIIPIYPHVRLNEAFYEKMKLWVNAVPNLLVTFLSAKKLDLYRLRKYVAFNPTNVKIFVYRTDLSTMDLIPRDLRRYFYWIDGTVLSSAISGGYHSRPKDKSKVETFIDLMNERSSRITRMLRA